MRVLIIGGTGYIGSRLYQFLKEFGVDVCTVDDERKGNYVNPNNYRIDFSFLDKAFFSCFSHIILLAGNSSVADSVNLTETFDQNVRKFVDLTEKLTGQVFIYASSSSVYGVKSGLLSETEPLANPVNPYDLSKTVIDRYLSLSNIHYYGLRFGTVNGVSPNMRTELIVNRMVQDAKLLRKIRCINPEVRRPILVIKDLCEVILKILTTAEYSKRGIYNVASFNTTVGQIAEEVRGQTDCKIEMDRGPKNYDFWINCLKIEKNFPIPRYSSILGLIDELSKR